MAAVSARFAFALGLAALALLASVAGAADPVAPPAATAEAWAVQVVLPNGGGGTSVVDPSVGSSSETGFAYPGDGSVVSTLETSAAAKTAEGARPPAVATSSASGVIVFGGDVTVDEVSVRAIARAGSASANGEAEVTEISGLRVFGLPPSGSSAALEDWGTLSVGATSVDQTAPSEGKAYTGSVTAVQINLTAAHGGLPAGSTILIGHAEAHAETAGAAAAEAAPAGGSAGPAGEGLPVPEGPSGPRSPLPYLPIPESLLPSLDGGPYVFPVFGEHSWGDTYGAARADVTYHHGNDVFGELGQPLLAVADGTVFAVGWNKIGGLRLWLRDRQGNTFYYAHLAAFSTLVFNGARVRAGQVVGFMGKTGDAESTLPHLHFEVHPVSLLYLGYDGAVDPTPYMSEWRELDRLPFPTPSGWAPNVPGVSSAPQPGAILLEVTDISSTDGLDSDSLRRATEPPPRP
jgi:murein DD-endopeptidase MepM/ murein hydrolase activator NlpD